MKWLMERQRKGSSQLCRRSGILPSPELQQGSPNASEDCAYKPAVPPACMNVFAKIDTLGVRFRG